MQVSSLSTSQVLTTLSWSTPVPAGMLSSSNTYRVVTLVLDQASNKQVDPTGPGKGSAFRFDNQAPQVSLTFPQSNFSYNLGTLASMAGIADDGNTGASGLTVVEVLLKSNQLDGYWNGGDSNSTNDWDTTPGSKYGNWLAVTGWPPGCSLPPCQSTAIRVNSAAPPSASTSKRKSG